MTLMNGLALQDRAFLWTDTCWLDPDTKETKAFGPKGFQSTMFPCVTAMTTVGGHPSVIAETVALRFALGLGPWLEACENAARAFVKERPGAALVRLLVAGWCYETETARLFAITSDETRDTRPFEAQEVAWWLGNGWQLPAVQQRLEAAKAAGGLAPADMVEIAEHQRREPFNPDVGDFGPMMGIGGTLEQYEITREGVTATTVRSFDEWGEPLPMVA